MTREEFVKEYCDASGETPESLEGRYIAMPCECGKDDCKSWVMVKDENDAILDHIRSNIADRPIVVMDCIGYNVTFHPADLSGVGAAFIYRSTLRGRVDISKLIAKHGRVVHSVTYNGEER